MNLKMTLLAPLAVGCVVTASIAAPPPVQPPRQPTTPPPAVPGEPGMDVTHRVRLISAGENPQALRLNVAADLAQRTESNVSMSMNSMGMAMQMPTMHITNQTEVVSLDEATGDITYRFEVTDAELVDAERANPMMVGPMREAVASMIGTEGKITVTPRGIPSEVAETAEADMPGVDPNSMAMGVALPEEPIGVGGSWEVTTEVAQQGFTVQQVAVYEIVAINGESIDVKMTVSQTASEQEFTQQGMTMKLKQFTSNGTGTGTFRLDRLVPDKSELKQSTTMVIAMDGGPMGGQEMTQSMESTMTMVSEVIDHPGDGG